MQARPGLDEALARIEALNRELGLDPASDPVLAAHRPPVEGPLRDDVPEPVARAARGLIEHMEGQLLKIADKKRSVKERMDTYLDLAERAESASERTSTQEAVDRYRVKAEASEAALHDHEAALRSKIERLRDDPASMFLPLGTVVRFKGTPSYADSLGIEQRSPDREYPAAGSVGVVTRLNRDGEYPIAVSMRREFSTGFGDTYVPNEERFPTFLVDPGKIEVVGPGLLPNGQPCEAYGFVPTHASLDGDDEDGPEMVLQADGFFWRFHDFGGKQGVEALMAADRMDEMSWIGEPLDADDAPARGPGM